MRIAVLRTQVPFVEGGAERHAANLVRALAEYGHEAVEVTLPFRWYPAIEVMRHAMAAKLTDVERFEGAPVDLAIGLKFPAWLARHPNKVFWILHQHRQAYDQWEAGSSDLLHDADGAAVRAAIRAEDRAALAPAAAKGRVFANSANVAGRLRRGLGLMAEPLYHPPPNAEALRPGAYGDYVLAPGRVAPAKRQDLMLEALAAAPGVRLKIAGPADSAEWLAERRAQAEALGVADRVDWLGPVSDETMIRLYAEARAVLYTPIDEDYGYVTLEAMLAAKPLVLTEDSGGPLELASHEREALVVAPEPAAIGAALTRLMDDTALAERLGQAGAGAYATRGISWEGAVGRLLAAGRGEGQAVSSNPASTPETRPIASAPATPTDPVAQAPVPAKGSGNAWAPPPAAMPTNIAFTDPAALFAACDFGETLPGGRPDAGALAYFATHWRRFQATLALLGDAPPGRMLDLGQFPPFLFQALVEARFPGTRHAGVWDVEERLEARVAARLPGAPDFTVTLESADVERDPLPFADGSQDTVLAMEILEHLALDPLWMLAEALRVLAPGGRLLLTTPNIASHAALARQLAGATPLSFGAFVPGGGVHGRHNREWTPAEVRALGESAGFETERLATADLYGEGTDPEVAALLAARGDHGALRGGTILYLGKRPRLPRPTAPPEGLYHGDPRSLRGRLTRLAATPCDGRTRFAVENLGSLPWQTEGAGATVLYGDWRDGAGRLRHGGLRLGLGRALGPGERHEIALALGSGEGAESARGTLMLDLFQERAGRFSFTGRCPRLALACDEAAYLRLLER